MEKPLKKNRDLVISVDRAFSILNLVAERQASSNQPRLTVSEVSRSLGIPKSSTSYLLSTMEKHGFLQRDTLTQEFKLGLQLLSLGGLVKQSIELRKMALDYLNNVVEQTELGAHLAILDRFDVLYVERVEAPGIIKMDIWPGKRIDPRITAVGKAIMCHLERHDVLKIAGQHGASSASMTLPRLFEMLKDTRALGYATDYEEHAAGVRCVAAPVFDESDQVAAAIGVSGTVSQLDDERIPKVGNIVMSEALKLSRRLGFRAANHSRDSLESPPFTMEAKA